MCNKNLKKFVALVVAATMVCGGSIISLAAGSSTSIDGTGSYEGAEMQYPTISVTLPTLGAGVYDYIADPNGLITTTDAARYPGATFTGATGIYFLNHTASTATPSKFYSQDSATHTAYNNSAQDVNLTVKIAQKTAGSSTIKYASSNTFTDASNTTPEIYLAVVDSENTASATALTSASVAASLTKTLTGASGNFDATYTKATDKYEYVPNVATPTDASWSSGTFNLTGALNPNATWADGLTFPTITVTWSYEATSGTKAIKANAVVSGGTTFVAKTDNSGFGSDPSVITVTVDGRALSASEYTVKSDGIIKINTALSSGAKILVKVGNTVYEAVVS